MNRLSAVDDCEESGGSYTAIAKDVAVCLLEHANDPIVAFDRGLHVLVLNAAFHEKISPLLPLKPELGQRIDRLLGPLFGSTAILNQLCRETLSGQSSRSMMPLGQHKQAKTWELSFRPIIDTVGDIETASLVLRELNPVYLDEAGFHTLLEAAPDAMIVVRSDGTILAANSQTEQMFDLPRERLIGQVIESLLPERLRAAHQTHRRRYSASPTTRPMPGHGVYELLGLRSGQYEFPVEISLSPMRFKDETLILAAIRDMSRHRTAEEELRRLSVGLELRVAERTAALESANRQLVDRIGMLKQTEHALAASAAEAHALFEQAAVGIARLSLDGRWLRVNQTLCRITGYGIEELLERNDLDLTYSDDRAVGQDEVARLRLGMIEHASFEKRYIRKNGQVFWARITVALGRDTDDRADYLIAVIEDISLAKHTEQANGEMKSRLQLAVDIAGLGFFEWTVGTDESYISPEFKKQLGFADHELPNRYQEWESRLHPDDRPSVLALIGRFLNDEQPNYAAEFRMLHRDGSYRWISARAIKVRNDTDGELKMIGIHLDVTDRRNAEQRLKQAALHDTLTGLPNRALLFEYAHHMLAGARRNREQLAIVYIDLDRFKPVNDTYGHEIGDAVLKEVASRLKKSTRQEDIVVRLGGDEFLVLLPHVESPDDAAKVAEHITLCLNRSITVNELELTLSPSIGISLYPSDGESIDTLIHHADTAMYHAKQLGRNNTQFYTPALAERAQQQATIEHHLKEALAHREFCLNYQPVIDVQTHEVVGVEALLRWPHAGIGPDRFVPVAEATGLIGPLGEWVMCEACRQHAAWRADGLPAIPVAVNVSPVQFRNKDFASLFSHALDSSEVNPMALQIELTESALMEDIDYAVALLKRFRDLGVKIALDDFGTGYSSLSYLSRLPLDKIKLDKSFVHRLENDKASRAITEAIIALGRNLGLEIVAEGIENDMVLQYLMQQGCDQAQGYYVCHPISGDAFVDWYGRWTAHA